MIGLMTGTWPFDFAQHGMKAKEPWAHHFQGHIWLAIMAPDAPVSAILNKWPNCIGLDPLAADVDLTSIDV